MAAVQTLEQDCFCVGEGDQAIAATAKALAHPARLAILRTIAKKERCNCRQICSDLPLAQSTISQHLKVLREAGLIELSSDGPNSRYSVRPEAFEAFVAQTGVLVEGICAHRDCCT